MLPDKTQRKRFTAVQQGTKPQFLVCIPPFICPDSTFSFCLLYCATKMVDQVTTARIAKNQLHVSRKRYLPVRIREKRRSASCIFSCQVQDCGDGGQNSFNHLAFTLEIFISNFGACGCATTGSTIDECSAQIRGITRGDGFEPVWMGRFIASIEVLNLTVFG